MAQMNLVGKEIFGYKVTEKLGSGSFGKVYKAVKTDISGQYIRALKHITIPNEKQYYSVLNSMGGDVSKADNYFLEMLEEIVSEIKILNDLSENGAKNIMRYYEHNIVETVSPKRYDIYILMEYLTPLEDFVMNEDICVRDVVRLGLDVLSGLELCHANKIIHRDIKDDNIFVSEKGEYKIGDFGVSKELKDSSKADSMKGTPNFLAPEIHMGKNYTKSVDLYSLGIVMYRLLNYSRNPFLPHFPNQYFAKDEDIAFERRMKGDIPELPSLGGKEIGEVVVKAILENSERFQTTDEFKRALMMAVKNTSKEVLETGIKFNAALTTQINEKQKLKSYQKTIGEISSDYLEKTTDDTYSSPMNKELFGTIGETISVENVESEIIRKNIQNDGNDLKSPKELCQINNDSYKKYDDKETINVYREKVKKEDAEAQYNLGNCYYYGKGVEQNYQEAALWYKKAARQGYAPAQYMLGEYCLSIEPDYIETVKWYRKAAEQGYAEAQYGLGICYHEGRGIKKDYAEAEKWWKKAADQGHKEAQIRLDTNKNEEIKNKKHVKRCRKAAEQGCAEAQCMLGVCYSAGEGVNKDYREAVKWYQKAAEQGDVITQYNLGCCYLLGNGVEKDYGEAIKWFRKAVEEGYPEAQYMLGFCYHSGYGVNKDYKEAKKWYQKAVEKGHKPIKYGITKVIYRLSEIFEK